MVVAGSRRPKSRQVGCNDHDMLCPASTTMILGTENLDLLRCASLKCAWSQLQPAWLGRRRDKEIRHRARESRSLLWVQRGALGDVCCRFAEKKGAVRLRVGGCQDASRKHNDSDPKMGVSSRKREWNARTESLGGGRLDRRAGQSLRLVCGCRWIDYQQFVSRAEARIARYQAPSFVNRNSEECIALDVPAAWRLCTSTNCSRRIRTCYHNRSADKWQRDIQVGKSSRTSENLEAKRCLQKACPSRSAKCLRLEAKVRFEMFSAPVL